MIARSTKNVRGELIWREPTSEFEELSQQIADYLIHEVAKASISTYIGYNQQGNTVEIVRSDNMQHVLFIKPDRIAYRCSAHWHNRGEDAAFYFSDPEFMEKVRELCISLLK